MGTTDEEIRFLSSPKYYDAPDGQDPVGKVVSTVKKGFLASLLWGVNDCVFLTSTKNALQTINCLAYWIVPTVGISATFASVTYMSTKLRGKDDPYNYAMGALACAPILHSWRKSTPTTLYGTVVFMAFAMLAKHKHQHGWEVFPEPKHNYGIYQFDMSIVAPRDKNFRSPYL